MLIDDFSGEELFSPLGSKWRGASDRDIGGISIADVTRDFVDGQTCLRLAGDVRKENGGGFIQASLSFSTDREHLDATDFAGIRLSVCGNGECIQCIFAPRTADAPGNPIDPNFRHSRSGNRSPYL